MTQLTSVELQLFRTAELLGPLRERFVFVGGAIRGLLVTDPAAQGVRPTDDIDTIVEVGSLSAFHELELELQRQGFKHDLRDDAPICRFASGSVTLDVMPIAEEILGFFRILGITTRSGRLLATCCREWQTTSSQFG